MNQAIIHVLSFFKYEHLPPHLQDISKDFHELAHKTAQRYPDNRETTIALRKLLEAKDAAVRCALPEPDGFDSQKSAPEYPPATEVTKRKQPRTYDV